MAAVQAARGTKLLIKIGDGGAPEVFTQYCSINSDRGITFSSDTSDQDIPDCTDPELLAWVAREKTSLSAEIAGAGVLNTPDTQEFFDYFESPDSRNCMVVVDVPSLEGGVIFTGKFHLTQFEITGNRGEKMQASVTFISDGAVTAAANAP
jgi:predicted secreted protein